MKGKKKHWVKRWCVWVAGLGAFVGVVALLTAPVSGESEAQAPLSMEDLEKQATELAEMRQKLLDAQIETLKTQVKVLKERAPGSKALEATQAILDYKLARERVRKTLKGARIVADDGTYLGCIGPSYDLDSIFCPYGDHGSKFSDDSIWNTFGEYGSRFSEYSPLNRFSDPPKILVDGEPVATLTVGTFGYPVALSPDALKSIFADE